jgi:hypothetical protein
VACEAFIEKKFTGAHKQVIRQANQIIKEYQDAGYKLTLRQIHYQFVARDLYENTFANYKRLGNILDLARKAGLVDWDAIEDPTRLLRRVAVWNTPEEAVQRLHETFKLDPWDEQPTLRRIEVWLEKDAAVSIVRPTCDDLRIPYFSCRGYSSSSGLYDAGKRLAWYAENGYETLVLYLGDHDPSGVQMTHSTDEKVNMFACCEVEFRRIALTLDQVAEFNPPPNFVKETDSRTKWYVDQFNTEDCWELDALAPQAVDKLIRAEIEPLIDRKAWDKTMTDEEEHLRVLSAIIEDWPRTKAAPDMLNLLREHSEIRPQVDRGVPKHPDSDTLWDVVEDSQKLLDKHGLI